ncbi:biopolymer transporter ExbD [Terricaulis silvestris]|uniref:Biopolymer transport protein ExbD n=1 Tax=Terricaulis silvestris TaxID=2686094 RepID=A0A6I6MLR4_9CAUL|nr:biopolymer transporter ExbD [Terricaulis silvestris]QGZ95619.1 Biopolymer transport protein ExbD [Terricaulis silvestris]
MAGKISSGGGKKGRLDVNADPNVIPFIDVMLVLVIIFMIAAPISSVDIEVDMPASKIDPSKRPPRPTWISLSAGASGVEVYVMNDLVAMDRLGEATYESVKVNSPQIANDEFEIKDQRIYIRADAGLEYRNVVRAMNRLQEKGFTKIGFVAEDRR